MPPSQACWVEDSNVDSQEDTVDGSGWKYPYEVLYGHEVGSCGLDCFQRAAGIDAVLGLWLGHRHQRGAYDIYAMYVHG